MTHTKGRGLPEVDDDFLERLEVEDYLNFVGADYRLGNGSRGAQFNIKECPAEGCGDNRWKVYVGVDTGYGNCFVCDAKFNKWTLAKAYSRLTESRDIAEHIKEVLGDNERRYRREKTKAVIGADLDNSSVKLPASLELPTAEGLNAVYLENRGITGDYARYFGFRWCSDAWHNFERMDGTQGGQFFGDRILIPIYDLDAKVRTFQGRDISGTAKEKYLFPARMPATGMFLYNGHNAVRRRAEEVLVGEGAFDVAALKIACDKIPAMNRLEPIGTFGKHLSTNGGEDQLNAFMRLKAAGLKRATFFWDGEYKALMAALDAAKLLTAHGLQCRVALLPEGKDPNEVTPLDIRDAWINAQVYTPALHAKLRLKPPYRKPLPDFKL